MVIKNGYEARLAKMAGDNNVTIPAPTNAYQKYLDEIGAKGSFVVTVSYDSDNSKYVCDKTTEEILNALNIGAVVFARLEESGSIYNFEPSVWDATHAEFAHLQWHYSGDGSQTSYWTINARALQIGNTGSEQWVTMVDQYFPQS